MKKYIFAFALFVLTVFLVRFLLGGDEDTWICDVQKGEWIKHGNPSSSGPQEPCRAQVEQKVQDEVESADMCDSQISDKEMSYVSAKEIAVRDCGDGVLLENHYCNDYTGTWWIDFAPTIAKDGCNPACVVDVEKGLAEINWRCTGLMQ